MLAKNNYKPSYNHKYKLPRNYTLVQLVAEYKVALELANLFFSGSQAKVSANNATKEITDRDVLELIRATYLIEKNPDEMLTTTELGKRLDLSVHKTNELLKLIGFQTCHRDNKGRLYRKLTETGQNYAIYIGSGKKQADGTLIRQIKWHSETVNRLKMVW